MHTLSDLFDRLSINYNNTWNMLNFLPLENSFKALTCSVFDVKSDLATLGVRIRQNKHENT